MNPFTAKEKSKNCLPMMNVFYRVITILLKKYFVRPIPLQEKGSISIASTFPVVLILSILRLESLSVLTTQGHTTVNFTQATQAQYFGEAGIDYGIKRMFQGQTLPYSKSVSTDGGAFNTETADQASVVQLISSSGVDEAEKAIAVLIRIRPAIGDNAIYATEKLTEVATLDESDAPEASFLVESAPSLPDTENSRIIDMAILHGHVETRSTFMPSHGYVQQKVNGGRSAYGTSSVEREVTLNGSARLEGVLYTINPSGSQIPGGGSPLRSSVTGGIVANRNIAATGNHTTVYYDSKYMDRFYDFENRNNAWQIISWRELKLKPRVGLSVFVTKPQKISTAPTVKRMRVRSDNIHVDKLVEKLPDVKEMPVKKTEKYEEVPSTYSLTSLRSTMSSRNARRMTRYPDEVRRVVMSHYSAIQDCYTNLLKINPNIKGKVVIRFVVSPEGKVISASVVSSTINDNEMLECMLARVLRWNDFSLINSSAGNMAFKQTYVFGL